MAIKITILRPIRPWLRWANGKFNITDSLSSKEDSFFDKSVKPNEV